MQEFRETMRVPDSVARLDTVGRTSFRQAYSLTNLASRFASSPAVSQKLANRGADSAVSSDDHSNLFFESCVKQITRTKIRTVSEIIPESLGMSLMF